MMRGVAINEIYVDKGEAEWLQRESTELIAIVQAVAEDCEGEGRRKPLKEKTKRKDNRTNRKSANRKATNLGPTVSVSESHLGKMEGGLEAAQSRTRKR